MAEINQEAERQITEIRQICERIKPLVVIQCITYNHERYIRDALDGFVMQKTNFPFVAIVHDDASTDKTAKVIREYAEKYPEIILPIFETENQYSKTDYSLGQILRSAKLATGAKYVALCEGDDYWTNPLKLQKQIEFLELNPEYSMCATNVTNLVQQRFIASKWNTPKNKTLTTEQIIMNGGLFLATCSLVMRLHLLLAMPEKGRNLHVGDYPLQIYMAACGKVMLIAENSCVYRIASLGSWSETQLKNQVNFSFTRETLTKELHLLTVMDEVTYYKYHAIFINRKNLFIYNSYLLFKSRDCFKSFLKAPFIILKYQSIKRIIFSFLPQSIKQRYAIKRANMI